MKEKTHCFFAASNSYDGFISYFGEIFSAQKYEKIYILKGGPGTGKSSFMKEISNALSEKGVKNEIVLCSSDPNSYDGLILEANSKKVAIIDGTAPHSMDPTFPGAIEKIINLGDFWNESLLNSNRENIIALNVMKKQYYTNAYQYLSVAKRCFDIVFDSMRKICQIEIDDALDYFAFEDFGEPDITTKLYTAFGKEGFFELMPQYKDDTKIINIVGIYGSEYLFMEKIFSLVKNCALKINVSPSPLDKNKLDSIFIENKNILFITGNKRLKKSTTVIDTSKFINVKEMDNIRGMLETLYKERETMLWSATDEFKKAYDTHIEIEKNYVAAMNFKKNRKTIEKVLEEIKSTLLISDSTV